MSAGNASNRKACGKYEYRMITRDAMGNKVKILGILLFALVAARLCYSQAAKGYKFVTDDQVASCYQAGSVLTKAECDNLALEFNMEKAAQSATGLPGSSCRSIRKSNHIHSRHKAESLRTRCESETEN